MSLELTRSSILLKCGRAAFDTGERYVTGRKVVLTHVDSSSTLFRANVTGDGNERVGVKLDEYGEPDAECSCASFRANGFFCKHIAAVLLYLFELQQTDGSIAESAADHTELVNDMLELFSEKPAYPVAGRSYFETRTLLELEITCKPVAVQKSMLLGIELKVGEKRLYSISRIRAFLEHVDRGIPIALSKAFVFDPKLHRFEQTNASILNQLCSIVRNESLLAETRTTLERLLPIPPYAWSSLQPLLASASSVNMEIGLDRYDGLRLAEGPLPLLFRLNEDEASDKSYTLEAIGLDSVTVFPAYGTALAEGRLAKLPPEGTRRLDELKQLLEAAPGGRIRIAAEQLEPMMTQVIPGLRRLGQVELASSVTRRLVQTPLQARLFLDRVRDRLLAGLEFQYGDITINPLDPATSARSETYILIRDTEREEQIIRIIEQYPFTKTEGGYFMDEEEAEYDFLHHGVAQLELLLKVYATTAVRVRLHPTNAAPLLKIDWDERTDWLDFRFQMDGISEKDIRGVLQSLAEKRRYHRLPNGSLLPLESEQLQEMIRFVNEIGIRLIDLGRSRLRLRAVHAVRLAGLSEQGFGSSVKLGKSLRTLIGHLRNPDDLDFPIPEPLRPVLRDYQKLGYQWMRTLAHYRFGGILADDMGLGKTIQSIAFLVSLAEDIRESGQSALIVCPSSLMYNWLNELSHFAPELRVRIADGVRKERSALLGDAADLDVLITSYPLLRMDVEHYASQAFHTVILDEAQAFKNHTTQTAHAVKMLQARHRFALTGTPIENSLDELWSIYNAVFPELLPGRKEFGELSREAVAKRVRPFLLRRLKTDVLTELPEKLESLQASELYPEQKALYAAYLAQLQAEALKHLDDQTFRHNRIRLLAGLTRLRQLCLHPALFVEGYDGRSAKFEQFLDILEDCRVAGKRVLVFSQFTEMLGLIRSELADRGYRCFYLDGETPNAERVNLCRRFNEGERDVFLLSLKAGGTGLNLATADTVILYDLWWNPAVEQQAMDRAHRIGQTNVVQVIRLVTKGTVEEKMYELQHRKRRLIDEVIQPGQAELSSLTDDELRELLSLDT